MSKSTFKYKVGDVIKRKPNPMLDDYFLYGGSHILAGKIYRVEECLAERGAYDVSYAQNGRIFIETIQKNDVEECTVSIFSVVDFFHKTWNSELLDTEQ